MTHRVRQICFVTAALLILFSDAGVAQMSMQQMGGYQGGTTRGQALLPQRVAPDWGWYQKTSPS